MFRGKKINSPLDTCGDVLTSLFGAAQPQTLIQSQVWFFFCETSELLQIHSSKCHSPDVSADMRTTHLTWQCALALCIHPVGVYL